jgi:hypothetical protein
MASAKDVKMGEAQAPEEPTEALVAAEADPGQVETTEMRELVRDPGRPDSATGSAWSSPTGRVSPSRGSASG